jgi:hypothetical protein
MDPMPDLLAELQALESELHRPAVRRAPDRLQQLLHPAFQEVGRSGRRYDRTTVVRHLTAQDAQPDVVAGDYAVRRLADGAALLSYRSAHRQADGTLTLAAHRCSVWLREASRWQLVYHQATPDDATADAAFFAALEGRRTRALVERDLPTLDRLHADDYRLVTPAGKVFTRDAYLAALRDAPFYAAWEIGEMQVRMAPAMAALRYRARLRFPSGRELDCWHSDLYECRQGRWQAVWSQATEIRLPDQNS